MVGLVRGRGQRAARGHRGRCGQPRRAADRHRARFPPSALPTRASQRSAPAVAGCALYRGRDRADGLGATPRRRWRACRRSPGESSNLVPEGLILLISVTDAVPAFKIAQRGSRAAAQRDRVPRLGRCHVHRQDRDSDRADAAVVGLVPAAGTDEAVLGRELARYAASSPSRNLTLQAMADAGLADVAPATRRRSSAVLLPASLERARPW